MADKIGDGKLWLTDINLSMLRIGKKRMKQHHFDAFYTTCDAERLFRSPDDYFDVITVAFGLRNMTHKDKALKEMLKVCKPGGKVMVLEFSKPEKWLAPFYDFYSFKLMPGLQLRLPVRQKIIVTWLSRSACTPISSLLLQSCKMSG